jgi:tetratricopeptide (TPR) repeat protein
MDIYCLGAVLYRLLTGKAAHQFDDRSPEAVAHAVMTREVIRPSKWAPDLKRDLDFIVLKALRKDPQERYATVEQFAEDLEAFLGSRTVRARTGNAWYRIRKFLRRYWIPVTAAALVIASLSAGLYVANRERAVAQRRFQDVHQLSNKLFDIDVQVRQLAGSTKARQLIVDTSLEYLTRLQADVRGDPELALEVGNAYMRVGRVLGVPITPNLGQMEQAEQNLRIAQDLIQSVLAAQPGNRTAMLRAAQIAHDRMILARLSGRREETLPLARTSANWLEKFNAREGDKSESSAILSTYMNVADQFGLEDQFDDALLVCRRGTEVARMFNSRLYIGDLLWVSAEVFRRTGKLDESLREIRESVEVLHPGAGGTEQQGTLNFILALIKEGRILGQDNAISLGRSEEAVEALSRAFEIADGFVHKDSEDQASRGRLAMAGIDLADILRHKDPARALDFYDHTLRHLGEIQNNTSFQRYEVEVLAGSSYALRQLGRPAEARQRLDSAFARLGELKLYPSKEIEAGSEADKGLSALGDLEAEAGNITHAIRTYQELLDRIGSGAKPETRLRDAVDLSRIWSSMAVLYRRTGNPTTASELDGRRMALWQQWRGKLPNNPFLLQQIDITAPH